MACKSSWISNCFDKNESNEMSDIDTQRKLPHKNEVQKINDSFTKEKMMTKEWLKEFAPKTLSDLVVPKPKLDQLNSWLQKASKTVGEAPMLLITGPPGVGKSTALEVLTAMQNIQLVEWESSVDIDNSELAGSTNSTQSQAGKFEAFLMNSGRYISVLKIGEGMKKLILVREFPNILILRPNLLQDILRRYHVMGRVPVVFSLPEQTEGSEGMFPKQFLEELNIRQISFNKVSNKSVMKALKRICMLNTDCDVPSAEILEKIVGSVHGDIRSAVLQLYYECVQNKCRTREQHSVLSTEQATHKKRSKITKPSTLPVGSSRKNSVNIYKKQFPAKKASQELESGGKDRQLPIFQRVGRLLYPKKSEEDAEFLAHDPEDIVDQTLSHPRKLFHMVLENYLKVFRDMSDSCRAICYASDSDTMMSEFKERELTLPMALSTMARGFMTCKSTVNRKWTPLTNQEYFTVRQRTRAVREKIIDIDPRYILVPRDAAMDILPIIHTGLSSRLGIEAELTGKAEGSSNLQATLFTVTDSTSEVQVLSGKVLMIGKSQEKDMKDEERMTGTGYEIQESESDDENKISEEHVDAWIEDGIDFLDNFHHF